MSATPGACAPPDWSSRSLGRRWQHRFFYVLLRFLGLKPARFVLFWVVLVYCLRPKIAGRAKAYLRQRFGCSSGAGFFFHVFKLYWMFGSILLERAAAGILGKYSVSSGTDILWKLLEEGRGVILLGAHVGAWQIALAGLKNCGGINIVQPRNGNDVDLHVFEHGSARVGPVRIIDPEDGAGCFVEIHAALKRGEIVCLMGDRRAPGEKLAVEVDFLGRKALFPGSAFVLASLTQAPLAVVFTRRVGESAVECAWPLLVRMPAGIKSKEAVSGYVSGFARQLELYVMENPYQFFNFYDLWAS
ncbi:MAG: lysophospholipid acyltransferase family protein [Deltaproteobacteria bacterium]|jgi:predicted LPLAT superfamily acyltransferase|nr:lysophospholipid acyltransferase family protein [Deltaproteobacteria bacterium]